MQKLSSIVEGINPPSSAGPWTGYELFNYSSFETKDLLLSKDHPYRAFGSIAFEVYLQASGRKDMSSNDWHHSYNDREGFAYILGEGAFGDYFYTKFAFEGKNTHSYNNQGVGESWFSGNTHTNIIFSNGASLEDTAPFEALVAFANKNISLIVGRDNVSYGRGHSGNLLIADNAPYQDFVQLSAWNKTLTYKYLMVSSNLIDEEVIAAPTTFRGDVRLFVNHRLELNVTNKLRFTLNEGALFYSNRLDTRIFNPMMFLHNYHNTPTDLDQSMYGEVNNFMQFEVEIAILPKLSFYTYIFIDQIEELSEIISHASEDAKPNAWGILGGFEMATPLYSGIFSAYIEGVYNSPYLYLRGDINDEHFNTNGGWNLSLISAHDSRTSDGVEYFGYKYGPDIVLIETGAEYGELYHYSFGIAFQYSAFGPKGLFGSDKSNFNLERGKRAFKLMSPSSPYTQKFVTSVKAKYQMEKSHLTCRVIIDNIFLWHQGSFKHNLQATIGINYAFTII